jgi:Tfp pilus assembly protein PilF
VQGKAIKGVIQMTLEANMNPFNQQNPDHSLESLNNYDRALEYVQAGHYQQALDCLQQHLRTVGGNAQVFNDTGAILHCLGRSEEAISHFVKARSLHPDSAEIVWNLVEAYLATNRPEQAKRLFDDMEKMEILNADVLNRTANVFLNQANKAGAIEMLIRSLKICPEQEILSPMIEVIRSKRPKVAFFCGGDGLSFLKDIYEFVQERFETRFFEGKTEEQLYELMQWSDISWFEWCTDLAVIGSRQTKVCENIVRLHRYEAYGPWPQQVDWQNIDTLITVGNSFVKEALTRHVPDIELQTSVVTIPNGVDLDKYTFTERPRGKNIAFLGNLRPVKNPAMVLQGMQKLHYTDPQYRLFFAGQFQDLALEQYMRHMVEVLNLRDVVFFDGWQENICSWLKDKHYIVSTSLFESQGMGVLEAMACGLKPVIHHFPGAKEIFCPEFLFNISEEFCEKILSASYEPRQYRRFVEENYPLKMQLLKINDILTHIENKMDMKHVSTVPAGGPENPEPEEVKLTVN